MRPTEELGACRLLQTSKTGWDTRGQTESDGSAQLAYYVRGIVTRLIARLTAAWGDAKRRAAADCLSEQHHSVGRRNFSLSHTLT